jgi:integrase
MAKADGRVGANPLGRESDGANRIAKQEAKEAVMAVMEKTKTPGVYKRGNRYVVTWRHRGKPKKEFFRTYAEAREAKGKRSAGDRRPTTKVRFGTYFLNWIVTYAGRTARGFSESTRPEYRRAIEDHAMPTWETWWIGEIEPGDVRDLFGQMRVEGKSTSQIKKTKAALSACFATAVDDRLIPSNPVTGVRIPPALDGDKLDEEEKPKALTRAEIATLLAEIEQREKEAGREGLPDDTKPADWVNFFEFLIHTGMRISEVVGLRWEHLVLTGEPHVKVREQLYKGRRKKLKSKSGKREIPLSPGMTAKLLARRRDHYGGPTGPVFASTTGTPLTPSNVYRRVLAPAAVALGLYVEVEIETQDGEAGPKMRKRSTVSFHTFRHTCASLLFDAGRNIKQVQEWLGHADPGFTLSTYVHLMDEGVGDAAFMDDEVGNRRATRAPEKPENPSDPEHGRLAA